MAADVRGWILGLPGWLEHRLGLRPLLRELRETNVPAHLQNPVYYLGALALAAFLTLVVTGVLLALHYVPSAEHAWDSVQYLTYQVPLGGFVRNTHRWASSLLVIAIVLHMLRVVIGGAYKKPREGTWLVGVLLLIAMATAAFTGSLLPWSQRGFYGAGVGAGLVGSAGNLPVIGPIAEALRVGLLGGPEVGPWTLSRFYTLHVVLLPLLIGGLIALHVFLVKQHDRRTLQPVLRPRKPSRRDLKPLWPTHLVEVLAMMLAFVALIALLGAAVDPTRPFEPGLSDRDAALLDQPADPFRTPAEIRPEWYFMGLDQLLKLVPPGAALTLVGLLLFGLVALPFVDRGEDPHPRKRLPFVAAAGLVLVAWVVLTVMGVMG